MRIKTVLILLGLILIYFSILSFPLNSIIEIPVLSTFQNESLYKLIKNIVITLFAFFAIKKFNIFFLSGLNKKVKWENKFLILIPLYLLFIAIVPILSKNIYEINLTDLIFLFFSNLSIGFSEEFFFRGLILCFLLNEFLDKKNGVFFSIFFSAILFSVVHLANFKVENLHSEISQFFYALFFGFFFGAVLLRTKKLLPIAIMHGLIDFFFSLNSFLEKNRIIEDIDENNSLINAIISSIIVLPLFLISLILIKKIKREDLITLKNIQK